MTKQPHLKDRIRARMVETGDSYMTARRHVLGPVARTTVPAPATRWRHLAGIHPQTAVARTLLANAGPRPAGGGDLSEALTLGLSGGIRLEVYESHYEAEDVASLYLTPRPLSDDLPFVVEPLERAGARVIVDQPGARGAHAALRSALDLGPVAVWLDLAEAGYAGLPTPFSGGAYHVVSVLDHDGTAAVLGDVADQPIEIDARRLTAARARIKKYKARSARLDGPPATSPYDELVRRGLDASVQGIAAAPRGRGPVVLDRLAAAMRDEDRERAWSPRFRRAESGACAHRAVPLHRDLGDRRRLPATAVRGVPRRGRHCHG